MPFGVHIEIEILSVNMIKRMTVFLCAYVDQKSELLIRVNGKVQGRHFEKLELTLNYAKFWP